MSLNQRYVSFIAKSSFLRDAIQESFKNPNYHSMTTKEQLSEISKSFKRIRTQQAVRNERAPENRELANQKEAKVKAEPAPENSVLNLF